MNLIKPIDEQYEGGSYPAFVTLDLVKQYIGTDFDDDDNILTLQIDSAVKLLETMTGQSFSNGTYYFTYPFKSYYGEDQLYTYDVLAPDTTNFVVYTRDERYKDFDNSATSLTVIHQKQSSPNGLKKGIAFETPNYDKKYLIVKVPQSWTADDYPDVKKAIMTLVAAADRDREMTLIKPQTLNIVYNQIRKYRRV